MIQEVNSKYLKITLEAQKHVLVYLRFEVQLSMICMIAEMMKGHVLIMAKINTSLEIN